MNKHSIRFFVLIVTILVTWGINVSPAFASLPNPETIIPIPSGQYARFSNGPHPSGVDFLPFVSTNPTSSIDLSYSGTVVAPISGIVNVAKDCGRDQIVFFRSKVRDANGYGWAIGLIHIKLYSTIKSGMEVTRGQAIGYTVAPSGTKCGFGTGSHIHFTLMKWKMGTYGPSYYEQNIVNTYLASWIVKNTYLDGATHDIPLGGLIK